MMMRYNLNLSSWRCLTLRLDSRLRRCSLPFVCSPRRLYPSSFCLPLIKPSHTSSVVGRRFREPHVVICNCYCDGKFVHLSSTLIVESSSQIVRTNAKHASSDFLTPRSSDTVIVATTILCTKLAGRRLWFNATTAERQIFPGSLVRIHVVPEDALRALALLHPRSCNINSSRYYPAASTPNNGSYL